MGTEDEIRLWAKHSDLEDRRKARPVAHWRKLANFVIPRLRRHVSPSGFRTVLVSAAEDILWYGIKKLGPDYQEAMCDALLIQVRASIRDNPLDKENHDLWRVIRSYSSVAGQRRIFEIVDLLDEKYHDSTRCAAVDALTTPFWARLPKEGVFLNSLDALALQTLSDQWVKKAPAWRLNLRRHAVMLAILTCNPKVPELLELLGRSTWVKFDACHIGDDLYVAVHHTGCRKDLLPIYDRLNDIAAKHGRANLHEQRDQRRKNGMYG